MKKIHFSKLENKYYYGFSRTFWHFVIGAALVAAVVAISVVAYSYFPSSKDKVVRQEAPIKAPYPSQAEVTLSELLASLPKEKIPVTISQEIIEESPVIETTSVAPKQDTLGLSAFEFQIGRLKNVLPPSKFKAIWDGEGEYVYSDRRKYEVTKSEQFRTWVTKSDGLKIRILKTTSNAGFKSYREKAALVNGYYNLIKVTDDDSKDYIINQLVTFKNQSYDKTVASLDTLAKIIAYYPKDEIRRTFRLNSRFLINNPNDGLNVLSYEMQILPNFDLNERIETSMIIKDEYKNFYNNNVPGLSENTSYFLKLLPRVDKDQQSLALVKYYQLYKNKNSNRAYQIQEIEANYQQKLANIENEYESALQLAELKYQTKKVSKSALRKTSFIGVGIAIGAILIITVILLLLSMVRNVNRLAQAMLENTANQNKKNN